MSNIDELFNAIRFNEYNIVQEIVTVNPALVNAANEQGYVSLYVAMMWNHANIVKLLIKNGANIDAQEDLFSYTVLHLAAIQGYKDLASFLIDNGADINIKDKDGNTPLCWAVEGNQISIIELIVNRIAKLEAASLHVDEKNLQLSNQSINYPQNLQKCKEEIEKITKENKSLINFLKAENSEESGEIWVENENVRNAFGDQERLKEQYPKYADMLIHKANEVKAIFLDNHRPLIDALSKLCERNFNNMTFNDIAAFCNDKYLVIDDLKLPLTNFIDFGDVKAKHPVSLKVQTFAKTAKVSTICIEKNKNVGTSLTDTQLENAGKAPEDGISRH